ncbi:MAG TPA: hypothetical protein ENN67_01185, partial [Firmicutes bacterium]|nr:hypothetical protein [Bacillota bacterium]
MTRNKTLVWLMWPVLILSFLFAGACSNGDTPTIPDGVLNLSDGGDIGQNELNALTTAYQTLKENHGGVQIVEDSEGYGLIGIMDRWTGASLSGTAVIQDNNGDLATVDINGSKLFSNVEWPITISVFVDGYVTQTLISTKANLFIFAMELTDPMNASIAVYAACQSYDSGGLIGGISPWRLTAVTTNNWDAWNSSEGQFFDAPFVVVRGNPYRNLGIVAFLMPPIFPGSGSTIAPPPPPAYGYFYKDLEWGPPGAITGWVFQAPETPVEPFSHEAGTWTINTSLFSEVQTAVLTFTGGGAKADGWQFVPYGLQTRVTVVTGDENNGVYNFDAYAPDVDADREVVEAKVRYP